MGEPRRAKAPVPTEHQEQSMLFQWADLSVARHPELVLLFAIPNFSGRLPGKLTLIHSARLNREGRKKGVPDLFLPSPQQGYHGLFVELKRQRGGTLSPEQRAWHEALRAAGYRVEVCKGWEAARDVILQYLTPSTSAAA